MREQFFLDWFSKTGYQVCRGGKETTEIIGFCMSLWRQEIDEVFNARICDNYEYILYYRMYESQKDSLVTEFRKNPFSRRLFIQFSRDFHYKENGDMMPCIASIQILFVSSETFNVVANLRSSDVTRLHNDIMIIAFLCRDFMTSIGRTIYNVDQFFIQFGSLHQYVKGDEK